MSDKKILVGDMSRETAIGILKLMLEAMEVYDSIAPTSQRRNAVQMAIASLETDEAYQLEYERTTKNDHHRQNIQAYAHDFGVSEKQAEKELRVTTKNDLGVDCISRAEARKTIIDHQYSDSFCEEHNIDHSINTSMALIALSDLPSVTPQLSSELEKNSKKLEKGFGELDCISRKEAISWIENLRTLNEHYHPNAKDNHLIDCDSAIDYLKQVPSVLPKVKTGHWIYIGQSYLGNLKICECSNCKKRTYGSHDYCPNCGADMREVEE